MKRSREIFEVKRQVLAEVGGRVARFGFPSRASGQAFYKRVDGSVHVLHLSFAEYGGRVQITADVAVRLDDVEELVNESNSQLSAAEKRKTATLGCDLNRGSGGPAVWDLGSGLSVEAVAESIVQLFVQVGLPYLEAYSSREAVMEVLRGDDSRSWRYSPVHAERARRAVALSYLMGGAASANRTAAEQRALLHRVDPSGIPWFDELALLRQISPVLREK